MTRAPANVLEAVMYGLQEIAEIREIGDGIRVTTHCMYPSNGLVRVVVRGGMRTIVASDEGGAIGEAMSAGIPVNESDRAFIHLVRDQGLLIKNRVIFTPAMPIEAAPLAVLHVANASKEVAQSLYDHAKIKRSRDFKAMLAEFLERTFDDRVSHNEMIVGKSNKPHKFANVIALGDGRRLIVDPVSNEPSSVNSRVVANMDVRAIEDPNLDQRIVYDDEEVWSPADLNLLQLGATVVPFSRSTDVIRRIALHG